MATTTVSRGAFIQRLRLAAGVATMTVIAACSSTPPPAPVAPPPVAVAPAPAPMPMPVPPNSAAPTMFIPPIDVASGRRMTPNVNLSPEQSLWQFRIAMNVAALNCRGPEEEVLVANYTRFLASHRAAIARAERWVIQDQARQTRTNGISSRDALSTKLFNYFASPPIHEGFCRAATNSMALVVAEPTANILPFSIAHLTLIDQPFVDFYAAFDQYKADYARWQALQPGYTTASGTTNATGVGPQSTLSSTGPSAQGSS